MNKEDIICTSEEVDLDGKERDMIEKMVLQWRLKYANVDGKIIRKTDLKNHSVLVVKLIIHNILDEIRENYCDGCDLKGETK